MNAESQLRLIQSLIILLIKIGTIIKYYSDLSISIDHTLIETVQSLLQSGISIFRVSCITYIIQLCLQELLGKLKIVSENNKAESEWSNKQNLDLQTKCSTCSIINIFKKIFLIPIQEFAVFINASPQHHKTFLGLQKKKPKIVSIQDIYIYWNLTFLMLTRAQKLQSCFDKYCTTNQYTQFKLNNEK
ncbi:hypothetical protein N7450_010084 [Penicillium hetheringtonii]|uniref:Uncharacterized protein n=1 Tax=Penicillium hetheringtonii TaxID=911720 RepID=A0AAD6DC40_9EURO|nr:hypothetical protein N7450_010084 [Penicillium hetheringtonii]